MHDAAKRYSVAELRNEVSTNGAGMAEDSVGILHGVNHA